MSNDGWKALALDKKQRQQQAIPNDWLVTPPPDDRMNVLEFPRECGLLTAHELEITESNVETLLPKLAAGEWSSVDVTRAFYKRAIVAQQVVNCLTEIFVEQALRRAADVDAHLKSTGEVIGPLHGLPISLKDQLSVKGLETVMGYVSWVGRYADRDAALVEILYDLGAVPFVRTNVPQTLMLPETFNNVFGMTTNPRNRNLTPGGSSGGEGALVGMRGSPLGIGSDIGGSVRIPCAFNGLYGLRPSYHRVPYWGAMNTMEGQESILSVLGPLTHSLFGVKAFMKAVFDAKPWRKDPLALRMPWNEAAFELSEHGGGRDLVFAILWDDGNVIPHPPIRRALEMTKAALLAAGHKIIDWEPYKHDEMCALTLSIWRAGGLEDFAAVASLIGEPVLQNVLHQPSTGSPSKKTSAYDLWQIHRKRLDIRKEYLDRWEATAAKTGTGRPVDAIISPVSPFASPPHGENKNADYTAVWNFLDYPSLVLPVTEVNPALDPKQPAHKFLSEQDKDTYALYVPETFKGAAVGLQLVGRTQEEEALLGMGGILDRALAAHKEKV